MIEKNPQLAIDALAKYLSVTATVAKATYDRLCCSRAPTFAQRSSPNSPYSLVSKDGGLVNKLHVATQMLADVGSVPAPLSKEVIAAAIDAFYVKKFVEAKANWAVVSYCIDVLHSPLRRRCAEHPAKSREARGSCLAPCRRGRTSA